jgi:hypothetical protein
MWRLQGGATVGVPPDLPHGVALLRWDSTARKQLLKLPEALYCGCCPGMEGRTTSTAFAAECRQHRPLGAKSHDTTAQHDKDDSHTGVTLLLHNSTDNAHTRVTSCCTIREDTLSSRHTQHTQRTCARALSSLDAHSRLMGLLSDCSMGLRWGSAPARTIKRQRTSLVVAICVRASAAEQQAAAVPSASNLRMSQPERTQTVSKGYTSARCHRVQGVYDGSSLCHGLRFFNRCPLLVTHVWRS